MKESLTRRGETPEERTWPWIKRQRMAGPLGEGCKKFSPEKSPQKTGRQSLGLSKPPETSPETRLTRFSDIGYRDRTLQDFVVALRKERQEVSQV